MKVNGVLLQGDDEKRAAAREQLAFASVPCLPAQRRVGRENFIMDYALEQE